MFEIVFSALALFLSSLHPQGDYMGPQFAVGLAFMTIPIAYFLSKQMGTVFGILAGYVAVQSAYITLNMHGRYKTFPVDFQNSISINAGFCFLMLLIMLLGMLHTPKHWMKAFRIAIPIYTASDAIYVIHSAITGFRLDGGFGFTGYLDYCGMNGCLIALGMAFLVPKAFDAKAARYLKYLGLLLSGIGMILSKTAIPFFVAGAVLAGHLISQRIFARAIWPIAVSLSLGWISVGSKMINSSGRFQAYEVFMRYLVKNGYGLFGTGLGTLKVFAPTVQLDAKFMVEMTNTGIKGWLWNWLHSEFLQTWFELGFVGFILMSLVYLQCLRNGRLRGDNCLFSLGLGLGVCALVNYPFRYFSTGFLAMYFLVESLQVKASPSETLG